MAPSAPVPAPCACIWRRIASDAADENARLRAEVERLKAVLEGKDVVVDASARFVCRENGKA